MNLQIEKKHENRIEFLAEGTDTGFINMLRRYAISRVPVLAIDTITFYDNSASMWDEYIAHRIGLMPVVTPAKTPASAEIIFSLDVEGPKIVKSKELKSSDAGVRMAQNNISVCTLKEGQRLQLEGKATLGTGSIHAKFQPGISAYAENDDGSIFFFVESFYQMSPLEIIKRSCDMIVKDINFILKAGGKKKARKKTTKKKSSE